MASLKKIWRHLGGVYFAIFLISCSALLVLFATFVESYTGSHLWAEKLFYKTPFFTLLLSLYFINILVSALRRYPFKKRHTPFLLTHLGLLMIIAGVFVKMERGVQGQMTLLEGTASSKISLPRQYALEIEHASGALEQQPLDIVAYYPHHKRSFKKWTRGNVDLGNGSKITADADALLYMHDGCILEKKELSEEFPETVVLYAKGFRGYAVEHTFSQNCNYSWEEIPKEHRAPLFWSAQLLDTLQSLPFDEAKRVAPWKGLVGEAANFSEAKEELCKRVFSIGDELAFPEDPGPCSEVLVKMAGLYEMPAKEPLTVESPLGVATESLPPLAKLEENAPLWRLRFEGEEITLGYVPNEPTLPWPFKGDKLLRIIEQQQEIPHHVRLRHAKTEYHPGTSDPKSYSCSLLIDGQEVSLRMNEVFEADTGLRFYLAGIGYEGEERARKVQLVVSHDPAKAFLTYPGAILVAVGIVALFRKFI